MNKENLQFYANVAKFFWFVFLIVWLFWFFMATHESQRIYGVSLGILMMITGYLKIYFDEKAPKVY